MNANFYSHDDIEKLCGVSRATAYNIISKLNKELIKKGYIVPKQGYVLKSYADKRIGLSE